MTVAASPLGRRYVNVTLGFGFLVEGSRRLILLETICKHGRRPGVLSISYMRCKLNSPLRQMAFTLMLKSHCSRLSYRHGVALILIAHAQTNPDVRVTTSRSSLGTLFPPIRCIAQVTQLTALLSTPVLSLPIRKQSV